MTTPTTTELHSPLQATEHDPFVDDVSPLRDLDHPTGDGLEVTLLWSPAAAGVTVRVDDRRTGTRFELAVDGADAADAFNHPFAYAG